MEPVKGFYFPHLPFVKPKASRIHACPSLKGSQVPQLETLLSSFLCNVLPQDRQCKQLCAAVSEEAAEGIFLGRQKGPLTSVRVSFQRRQESFLRF